MNTEEKTVAEEVKQEQKSKTVKKFTLLQSIFLLSMTLILSTGGGYALGNYYFLNDIDMKRVNEQLAYYQEQVRIDPANLENRIVLGYTHYLKGNNDAAIREFIYVIGQDEGYYDAHYNLGLVYLTEKRYNEALSSFGKTVQIAPRDFKGHIQLGVTYRHLQMYDEALEALNTANQLAPTNSDIIYETGLVAEAKGEYELAVDIYKDALQYNPLFEEAAKALDRLKDYDTGTVGD